MIAVADTHALLWAMTGQSRKLGRKARALFQRADQQRATIFVSAFSLVEIGELVARGRISLPTQFSDWTDALARSAGYSVHSVDATVAVHAFLLRGIPERADRIIAASAAALGCPLITRDSAIATSAQVELIWD